MNENNIVDEMDLEHESEDGINAESDIVSSVFSKLKERVGCEGYFNFDSPEFYKFQQCCNTNKLDDSLNFINRIEQLIIRSCECDPSISKRLVYNIACEAERRVMVLQRALENCIRGRESRISYLSTRRSIYDRKLTCILSHVKAKQLSFERRLRYQYETATKRLQELLFECAGELHKTQQRILSQTNKDTEQSDDRLTGRSHVHRWRGFLHRLEEDSLNTMTLCDVDCYKNKSEYKKLEKLVRTELAKGRLNIDCIKVFNIAKISYATGLNAQNQKGRFSSVKNPRNQKAKGKLSKQSKENIQIASSTNLVEMELLLSLIFQQGGIRFQSSYNDKVHSQEEEKIQKKKSNRYKELKENEDINVKRKHQNCYGRRVSRGTRSLPLLPPVTYLCSTVISWLLWPQFGKSAVDSRVYYCIEERDCNIKRFPDYEHNSPGNNSASVIAYSDIAFELAKLIADIYVEKEENFSISWLENLENKNALASYEWPLGLPIRNKEGAHRLHGEVDFETDGGNDTNRGKRRSELLATYPDVVVTEFHQDFPDAETAKPPNRLHFAPANIQNLLELSRFDHWSRNELDAQDRNKLASHYSRALRGVLGNLYVIFPRKGFASSSDDSVTDPLSHSIVVPLPLDAIDELITSYVIRPQLLKKSALTLGKEMDCSYGLIRVLPDNVSRGEISKASTTKSGVKTNDPAGIYSDKYSASKDYNKDNEESETKIQGLLVSFEYSNNEETQADPINVKSDIVSIDIFCIWRACNTKVKQENTLCDHHSDLVARLENLPDGSAEVKRHLPRLTKSQLAKLNGTKATLKASSLMTELMNEKLSKTIEGFCKRASCACRPKRRKDKSEDQATGDQITAVGVNRLKEAEDRLIKYTTELQLSKQILLAECKVVEELQHYSDLGIFPADELEAIRDEYKILDREREMLSKGIHPGDNTPSTGSRESGRRSTTKTKHTRKKREVEKPLFASNVNSTNSDDNISNKRYLLKEFDELIGPVGSSGDIYATTKHVITNELPLDQSRAETEFELEFCLRKYSILQRERRDMEASIKSGQHLSPSRSEKVLFDDNGYPMPLSSGATKRITGLSKPLRVIQTRKSSPYLRTKK